MAWVTPLVVIVAAAAVASLLNTSPFGSETITASDRSGDFELTIRSAKASYWADEPIVIEASLVYDGSEQSVRIAHGGGAAGGPLGFGTDEPVIGSLRLGTVFDMARHGTLLERGRPLTVPFTKGAGAFGNDPLIDQYTAYLEDPVLRLPPGTWHLIATAGFEGPGGDVELRAVIEILVTPAATSGPAEATPFTNGPVTDSATSGPFILSMGSAKERYEPGEPIDITAALTYLGPDGSVEIRHAIGARGSPLGFGIDETVLGDLRLGPLWETACVSTTMHASIPVDQEFMKASAWSGDDPRAAEYHEFIVSTGLRLPAGTWHVYSVAEFSVGDCAADQLKMRVDLTIVVGDPAPEPSEPTAAPTARPDESASPIQPDGSVLGVASDRLFELRLRAESGTRFAAHTPIDLFATYAYVGIEAPGGVTVGHFQPEIAFAIEQLGVENNLIRNKVYDSNCSERGLAHSVPASVPYSDGNLMSIKAVTVGGSFYAALEEGFLSLPVGRWRITAYLDTYVGGCQARSEAGHHALGTSIEIDVVATQFGEVSRAVDGPYSLELRSGQRVYRESDVIDVTGTFIYSGGETIDVQGFKPLTFSVAEPVHGIDLAGFMTMECNHATLVPGQRIERAFQKSGGFSADDPNVAFMREYLTDPVLRLPPGTWHIRVSGSLYERECGMAQHQLFAEIEILVLPDEAAG